MFRKLSEKLESLFDHQNANKLAFDHTLIEAKSRFVAENNTSIMENLSYVYNGAVSEKQLLTLFSQLGCYFEINFLFRRIAHSSSYTTEAAMFFGHDLKNVEALPKIKLPPIPISKVYRTGAFGFLKKFELGEIDSGKKMTAYLFRLSEKHTLLVATDDAEPWAKLKVESLHQTLLRIHFVP